MDVNPPSEGPTSQRQPQSNVQSPTRSQSASVSLASLTTQLNDDMEVLDGKSDAKMLDLGTIIAPSSPLSEPPSPLPTKLNSVDALSHVSHCRTSSDSESDGTNVKKRKTGGSTVHAESRKKRKVDSEPAVDITSHVTERQHDQRILDEESSADSDSSPPVKHVRQGRGGGRGRRRAPPVESSMASTREQKPYGLHTDDDDNDAPPSGSVAEATPKPARVIKHPRAKQAQRRATSPLSMSGSRSVSPAPSLPEQGGLKESRARSKSSRPSTDNNMIDWDVLAPLPISELEGMIIETLATSRATSLSASALWEALVRSRPALKTTARRTSSHTCSGSGSEAVDTSPLNKREWVQLLVYILAAGHLSNGLFGRVESSASDSDSRSKKKKCLLAASKNSSQPVTATTLHEISRTKSAQRAQWFYIPEKDPDLDRASLVKSMMRGPGKRSETMKYKRYYWKPLGKISRWDREDDL
jgi:hypothetical protein